MRASTCYNIPTMISIFYKNTRSKKIHKLEDYRSNSWISVEEPTDEELETVATRYKIDIGLLQDAMDINELPRVEYEDGILYVFTRFVYGYGTSVLTAPMLIVMTRGSLLTISPKSLPFLERFLNGKIAFNTIDRTTLLLKILRQISSNYTNSLNSLGKKIIGFSKRVENIKNKDIVQFIQYENILYDLNTALVRNETIFRNLMTGKVMKFSEDEIDLVEDLALENAQNMEIAKDNIRTIVNVRESYSTILTNNLNNVIKLFTSLTVILTIPTILGSFFGMNVALPLADHPYAFYEIIIVCLILMLILVVIFIKRDWL